MYAGSRAPGYGYSRSLLRPVLAWVYFAAAASLRTVPYLARGAWLQLSFFPLASFASLVFRFHWDNTRTHAFRSLGTHSPDGFRVPRGLNGCYSRRLHQHWRLRSGDDTGGLGRGVLSHLSGTASAVAIPLLSFWIDLDCTLLRPATLGLGGGLIPTPSLTLWRTRMSRAV
jgi:hypothetical protein